MEQAKLLPANFGCCMEGQDYLQGGSIHGHPTDGVSDFVV